MDLHRRVHTMALSFWAVERRTMYAAASFLSVPRARRLLCQVRLINAQLRSIGSQRLRDRRKHYSILCRDIFPLPPVWVALPLAIFHPARQRKH